jgi:hypothetical protein
MRTVLLLQIPEECSHIAIVDDGFRLGVMNLITPVVSIPPNGVTKPVGVVMVITNFTITRLGQKTPMSMVIN